MKTMKTKTQFEIHHKELTKRYYPYWTFQIRKQLPGNWTVSDDEIDSEITHQLIYLSGTYKEGKASYITYCNNWIVTRVREALMKEYRLLDHKSISDAYDEFDDNYSQSYIISHQYGTAEVSGSTTIDEHIEKNDIIETAKSVTDDVGRQIIDLLLDENEFNYDFIAKKLHISKKTIVKKLKEIREKI